MKRLLILAACLAAVSGPALAGQPVTLKTEIVNSDGLVTLGDLFDGVGDMAKIPVANRPGATVVLDAAAVQSVARRAGLDWANTQGLRRIVVRAGYAEAETSAKHGNIDVLTYARNIGAGEVVQPQDLVWSKLAAAPTDAPNDAEAMIGLAARRPLRAGTAVSAHDVSAPQVIKAGDLVTVTYETGGVSVSMQGKATANGALGDTFTVQNPTSKKILQAVATGPGQAVVGPQADQLKFTRRTQVAQR
jgi:flagella basal body P-ring formation protein FlgA